MAVLPLRSRSVSPRRYSPTTAKLTSFSSSGFASSSPVRYPSTSTRPRSVARFSDDQNRSTSPAESSSRRRHGFVSFADERRHRKTCFCSPKTHPGSYRCVMHRDQPPRGGGGSNRTATSLSVRRSAMMNSLVRIGAVEEDLAKKALSALIRPSPQCRRTKFIKPRPSRLSAMSTAREEEEQDFS